MQRATTNNEDAAWSQTTSPTQESKTGLHRVNTNAKMREWLDVFLKSGARPKQTDIPEKYAISIYEWSVLAMYNYVPDVDDDNRDAIIRAVRWAYNDPASGVPAGKSLLVAGPVGTGKTLLMEVLMYHFRAWQPMLSIFPVDRLRSMFEKGGYEAIDKIIPYIHIAIDDVGLDPMASHYGTTINVVEYIIHERYRLRFSKGIDNPLITHITANLGEKLKDHLGERLTSRVRELCHPILLTGKDRRK